MPITINYFLEVILVIFIYKYFSFQLKYKNYVFIIFGGAFFIQYVFPTLISVFFLNLDNRYYSCNAYDYISMQLLLIAIIFVVLMGQLIVGVREINFPRIALSRRRSLRLLNILMTISILAIFIQRNEFYSMFVREILYDRLILNEGKGYLQFLNYSSYVMVILSIYVYDKGYISKWRLFLYPLFPFILFSFKMQRGAALYPLLFIFIYFLLRKYSLKKILVCSVFSIPLLFFLNSLTSNMRVNIVKGEKLFNNVFDNQSSHIIPNPFAHSELLVAIMTSERFNQKTYFTFPASLVNIIPRDLYPNKPLTSGPTLSLYFNPDSKSYNGKHNTSYTTDPIIEGYMNGKILGSIIFVFIFSCLLQYLSTVLVFKYKYDFIYYPFFVFWLGFISFFSDLGNLFGYCLVTWLLLILSRYYLNISKY